MKYQIIYADPPWQYSDKSTHRGGAERHYPTMSTEDICALPIRDIAAEQSALFVWGTWPHLSACERVIEAWGFSYKTCAFVWVKTNQSAEVDQARLFPEEQFSAFWGMGHWTRSNTEFCLLAVRGGMPPPQGGPGRPPGRVQSDPPALREAGRGQGPHRQAVRGSAKGRAVRPETGRRLGQVGQPGRLDGRGQEERSSTKAIAIALPLPWFCQWQTDGKTMPSKH